MPGQIHTAPSHLLSTPDNIQQVQYKTQEAFPPRFLITSVDSLCPWGHNNKKLCCPRREEQTWAWPLSLGRGQTNGL